MIQLDEIVAKMISKPGPDVVFKDDGIYFTVPAPDAPERMCGLEAIIAPVQDSRCPYEKLRDAEDDLNEAIRCIKEARAAGHNMDDAMAAIAKKLEEITAVVQEVIPHEKAVPEKFRVNIPMGGIGG